MEMTTETLPRAQILLKLVLDNASNLIKKLSFFCEHATINSALMCQLILMLIFIVVLCLLLMKNHFVGPECSVCRQRIQNVNQER